MFQFNEVLTYLFIFSEFHHFSPYSSALQICFWNPFLVTTFSKVNSKLSRVPDKVYTFPVTSPAFIGIRQLNHGSRSSHLFAYCSNLTAYATHVHSCRLTFHDLWRNHCKRVYHFTGSKPVFQPKRKFSFARLLRSLRSDWEDVKCKSNIFWVLALESILTHCWIKKN